MLKICRKEQSAVLALGGGEEGAVSRPSAVGEGCSTGPGAFSTGIRPAGSRSKEEGAKDRSTSTSSLPSDWPAARDFPNFPSCIAQVLLEEVRELRNLLALPIRLVSRAHSGAEKAAETMGRGPWRLHIYKSRMFLEKFTRH